MNIAQYCCLQALSKTNSTIQSNDLIAGIQREFSKDGKLFRCSFTDSYFNLLKRCIGKRETTFAIYNINQLLLQRKYVL